MGRHLKAFLPRMKFNFPLSGGAVVAFSTLAHSHSRWISHTVICCHCYILISFFKNTKNLFIHIALIPEGDNPRVNPNILKCLLHSPVARGYRLVVIASRAMVCKTPTYYLILNSLAFARGCVILQLTHSLSSFAYFAFISSYLTLIILSEVL